MIVQDLLPSDLFAGKTVLITGGGSGINLGVARNFASLGAQIGVGLHEADATSDGS